MTEPPLPPERAFVVQLRAPADPGAELFVGRAEHMASGAAVRLGSAEDLIAFIRKVLVPPAPSSEDLSDSTRTRGKST